MCRMNAVMCMLCVVRKMGTSSIFSCRTGVPHFYAGTGMSRKTFFFCGKKATRNLSARVTVREPCRVFVQSVEGRELP